MADDENTAKTRVRLFVEIEVDVPALRPWQSNEMAASVFWAEAEMARRVKAALKNTIGVLEAECVYLPPLLKSERQ